jgi:SOS response regulatory protein OraA/RecX
MTSTKEKVKKTAWVKAMDYLARRDHSEKELIEKLRNFFTDTEIKTTLAEVKARGWLLPPEELSQKVTEQLNRKNKGYLYICHFLQKKGLPTLERDQEQELTKAMSLIESKINDTSDTQKLSSLLKNRGFDTETIGKVIYEIRRNSQSLY